MCFRFSGAELRKNTNPHSALMNYVPGCMDLHRNSKADHRLSLGLSWPGSAASVGDVAAVSTHHKARSKLSRSPYLHTQLPEMEVIKQWAGGLTA